MASTSTLVINEEPEIVPRNKIFIKPKNECFDLRLKCCVPFAFTFLILLLLYLLYNTQSCVLYIDGIRNATLEKDGNCSSVQLKYVNQTDHEVRSEVVYQRLNGHLIVFIVCLVMSWLVFVQRLVPNGKERPCELSPQ
ncbi:uncharacterized protein LOC116305696 [Actinia tenebrosa]|uniref:Uncharacterized protein LOC116305696 n=1 Tax=Actinia tenebrosa TaxID=6105 RepID=A0A6P8IWL8_ACTTE|nr:uncharacterized protein LOC116305696 [Actinia tenebrosa]